MPKVSSTQSITLTDEQAFMMRVLAREYNYEDDSEFVWALVAFAWSRIYPDPDERKRIMFAAVDNQDKYITP